MYIADKSTAKESAGRQGRNNGVSAFSQWHHLGLPNHTLVQSVIHLGQCEHCTTQVYIHIFLFIYLFLIFFLFLYILYLFFFFNILLLITLLCFKTAGVAYLVGHQCLYLMRRLLFQED